MTVVPQISSYLAIPSRNKIVFCKEGVDDLVLFDMGRDISLILETDDEETDINTLCNKLFDQYAQSDLLGKYLALYNIGILFEPQLKLNVRNLLENYSKDKCLIIISDAEIENDTFWFFGKESGISVSLKGLSYIVI